MSKTEDDSREDEPFTTPGDTSGKSTERLDSLDDNLFLFLSVVILSSKSCKTFVNSIDFAH